MLDEDDREAGVAREIDQKAFKHFQPACRGPYANDWD
jgi:hypothetical protein